MKKYKGIYGYWDVKKHEVAYVGKDSNMSKSLRCKQHIMPSRYNDQPFNKVLQNNPDRYQYYEICQLPMDATDDELNHYEKLYIKLYNPKHNYNEGGEGNSGLKHTPETKAKISKSHIGMKASDETKAKMSENNKGKNNPRSKYTSWDNSCVHYDKTTMYKNKGGFNPRKCFKLKYNGKDVNLSVGFNEWTSIEIINNLINEEMMK